MDMTKRITDNLMRYVATPTHTGTSLEKNNEVFFQEWFDQVPYLQTNPDHHGFYPIRNDHLDRQIPWALLKGQGNQTVVLIHHTDTVDTDDYGRYQEFAYQPNELTEVLKQGKLPLNDTVQADLNSGDWLFGRAVADMKGGGSVHLSLFEEYAAQADFKGNLVLLGLPDEENSSAGMRSAAYLLEELKGRHQLDYRLMLNVEPQERLDPNQMTIYDGSIGKIMPMCLVRGKLAHGGQIYLGLNPINLLSEIVRRTELHTGFIETAGNTTTPPGAWLYAKDRKLVYDVSLPLYAGGYMNILPLKRSPKSILEELKKLSLDAFEKVIADHQASYEFYRTKAPVDYGDIHWTPKVMFFSEIYQAVIEQSPDFKEELEAYISELNQELNESTIDRAEASLRIMEKTIENYYDKDPIVVWALAPPYYPSVNNSDLPNAEEMEKLVDKIRDYAQAEFSSEVHVQNYYTGICDLSYGMFTDSSETIEYIEQNMLLWGENYSIPLGLIKQLSMPVLNIGPWGKDFHKYTERVYLPDLLKHTPQLVRFTIDQVLSE